MLINKNVILCVIYNICCKKSNVAKYMTPEIEINKSKTTLYGSLRTFFEALKIKVNSFLNISENLKKLQANIHSKIHYW